jgi:hypothetical protein
MKDGVFRSVRCVVVVSAILLGGASAPSRAEWHLDANTGVFYDSNLSRASEPDVVRPGSAATLAAGANWFAAPTASDSWAVGASGGGELYTRYSGLNNAFAVANAAYRHKLDVGFAAPWIRCEVAAGYFGYDVDVRTGPRYAIRAGAGKRFTESFDAEIGGFYDRRYGPYGKPDIPGISGHVFDLRGEGAYFRIGYDLTERLLVDAKLAIRRGDVVSTSSENAQIVGAATAIAEDPTFGNDLYDYRLRGTTRTAVVTMSWALDERSSLNLAYVGESTNATAGLGYRSNSASLVYLYRY